MPPIIENNGLGFKGNTSGVYGLFNFFYDFLPSYDSTRKIVPYLGLGLGAAQIRNSAQVQNNKYYDDGATPISISKSIAQIGVAGQGVIGFSYYLDDYATIGMDYRYLSTRNQNNSTNNNSSINNSQYVIHTLNFVANFTFDKKES